jgi:hypothetical protein
MGEDPAAAWHLRHVLLNWVERHRRLAELGVVDPELHRRADVLLLTDDHTAEEYRQVLREAHGQPASARVQTRLTVDLAGMALTLDGTRYEVGSELALRWVKVLADKSDTWVRGPDLGKSDRDLMGCRTDRLKQSLPDAVANLIDSQKGVGSRIRLLGLA